MTNTTIPLLPKAIALTGAEDMELVQSGTSMRASAQQIANLAQSQAGSLTQIAVVTPLTGSPNPITSTGTIGLAVGGVDNSYMAPMVGMTLKGNNDVLTLPPHDMNASEVMTMLGAAPLDSPHFVNSPTAPTPPPGDSSTRLATTAFVTTVAPGSGVTSVNVVGGTTGLTTTGGPITTSGSITLGGVVAVSSGGTGQTTTNAAFGAISPIVAVGDLIVGSGPNSATRLPVGTNGQVLQSTGATVTWAAPPGGGTPSSTTPGMDTPSGAAGTALTYSRGDHLHPSDTTKLSAVVGVAPGITVNNSNTITNAGVLSLDAATGAISIGAGLVRNTQTLSVKAATSLALGGVIAGNGITIDVNGTITAAPGSGGLTSVGQTFTGGLISVAGSPITVSGNAFALTVGGTSGGIPFFNSGTSWTTSSLMTTNALIVGGGVSLAPKTLPGFTTDGLSTLTLGLASTSTGGVVFNTSGGNAVTTRPNSATGTYNFNYPIAAGSVGQVLTSQAGGITAMTWTTPVATAVGSGITNASGTLANSGVLSVDTATGAFTLGAGLQRSLQQLSVASATTATLGGFLEPPGAVIVYGRRGDQTWQSVVKTAGDTMTGQLVLAADPAAAMQAVTLQYLDAQMTTIGTSPVGYFQAQGSGTTPTSGNILWQNIANPQSSTALYISKQSGNSTDISYALGKMQVGWVLRIQLKASNTKYISHVISGTPVDSGTYYTVPVTLGSEPYVGMPFAGGSQIVLTMDTPSSLGSYMPLSGGTMTGMITLPATTPTSLQATTKSYVDTQDATKLSAVVGVAPGITVNNSNTITNAGVLSLDAGTGAIILGAGLVRNTQTLNVKPATSLALGGIIAGAGITIDVNGTITAGAGGAYLPIGGGTLTGAVTVPTGSVGAPSINFTGATTTGFNYTGGIIYTSFAGSVSLQISSTNVTAQVPFMAPGGSAGAPAHTFSGFSGETANGMWLKALSTPSMSAGGNEVMNWTGSTKTTTVYGPLVLAANGVGNLEAVTVQQLASGAGIPEAPISATTSYVRTNSAWTSGGTFTSILSLPNGTAANTALNFGTVNTGIYQNVSGYLQIVIGGTAKLQCGPSFVNFIQQAQGIDGSTGTPSFAFASETGLGIYKSSTANIRIVGQANDIVNFAGATRTTTFFGPAMTQANPSANLEVANKQYVDTHGGTRTITVANAAADTMPLGVYDLGVFWAASTVVKSVAHVTSGTGTYTLSIGAVGSIVAITGISGVTTSGTTDTTATASALNTAAANQHLWLTIGGTAAPGFCVSVQTTIT